MSNAFSTWIDKPLLHGACGLCAALFLLFLISSCIPDPSEMDFRSPSGEDLLCADVECAEDETCYRGQCYAQCLGSVDCEEGSRCVEGRCASYDCDEVRCATYEVCFSGICYLRCEKDGDCESEFAECVEGACLVPNCFDGDSTDENGEPCPELELETLDPEFVGPREATLAAAFRSVSVDPPVEHGFCWDSREDPSFENESNCESLGRVSGAGEFTLEIEGLLPGRHYFVRAFAEDLDANVSYGEAVRFTTAAPAPENVRASRDIVEFVEITWDAADDALGYEVFRNGESIEVIETTATTRFEDREAAPPNEGELLSPTELTATQGTHTDRVVVSWQPPAVEHDAIYEYTVVARYPDADSLPSAPQTGHRAAMEITGYEISIDGGASWPVSVTGLSYEDTDAPLGEVSGAVFSATKGDFVDFVQLRVEGAQMQRGADRLYMVRALSGSTVGQAPLEPAAGHLGLGQLRYHWYGSTNLESPSFSVLADTADNTHNATPAPATVVAYRAVLRADGVEHFTTETDTGFRATPASLNQPTMVQHSDVSVVVAAEFSSLGTPNPTAHGFCWSEGLDPSLDGTTSECHDKGAVSEGGSFQYEITGLLPNTSYNVRAFAINPAGTTYSNNRSFTTTPEQPQDLVVFAGDAHDHVAMQWAAVDGATGYRIYRDGELAGTVSASAEPSFEDSSSQIIRATRLQPAVTASQGDFVDRVVLEWEDVQQAPLTTHAYTVRAFNATEIDGPASQEVSGYRAATPIEEFLFRVGAGVYNPIDGDVEEVGPRLYRYDYFDADPVTLSPAVVSATQGTSLTEVGLQTETASVASINILHFVIRHVSNGAFQDGSAEGHRGGDNDAIVVQWERAEGPGFASFAALQGASAEAATDTTADADGRGYFYRLQSKIEGAEDSAVYSDPVWGFRAYPTRVATVYNNETARLLAYELDEPEGSHTGPRPKRAVAMDADGFVYVGANGRTGGSLGLTSYRGRVRKLQKVDGVLSHMWAFEETASNTPRVTALAVDADGYVYAGYDDEELIKISNASAVARRSVSGGISSLAVDRSGQVFAGNANGVLYLYDSNLSFVAIHSGASAVRSISVDNRGYITIARENGVVQRLTIIVSDQGDTVFDEVLTWTFDGQTVVGAAVDAQGYTYVALGDGTVQKFADDDTALYSTDIGATPSSIGVNPYGEVFVGATNGTVYRLDRSGSVDAQFDQAGTAVRGVAVERGVYGAFGDLWDPYAEPVVD